MSLMPQHAPKLRPSSLPPREALLKEEWHHLVALGPLRFGLLVLLSILLFVVSPLLPIAASLLWRWAAHSWTWRNRWASVTFWAKQGGLLVALILVYAALSATRVWILPGLTAMLQAWWHAHLLGDLSLSPSDPDALLARTLLWLPLAPALAVLYEYVDPRTRVQPQRVLTPADLAEPTQQAAAPPPSPKRPPARAKERTARSAPAPERKRKRNSEPPRQMTIERFLSPTPAAPPVGKMREQPAETQPPSVPDIDWDDVAE